MSFDVSGRRAPMRDRRGTSQHLNGLDRVNTLMSHDLEAGFGDLVFVTQCPKYRVCPSDGDFWHFSDQLPQPLQFTAPCLYSVVFSSTMASLLLPNPLTLDKPNLQSLYYFDPAADPPQWRPASSSKDIITNPDSHHHYPTDKLHLITWNIDFQVPFPQERMTAALQHLQDILSLSSPNNTTRRATVIFLQEMVSSDLDLIQETSWIRERFYITDLTPASWRRSSYGTTTLVDRRLDVNRVFRVPYATSSMQRDALFVDVGLSLSALVTPTTTGGAEQGRVIRLCNTHLESLASGTPKRPLQMKTATGFMHGRDTTTNTSGLLPPTTPHAAILAGDLNAFAPEDAHLPSTCGLRDAFLVLGGVEDTEESYTWGKQNPAWFMGRFPDARLDKVLFCGGVEVVRLERIGVGVVAKVAFDRGESGEEEEEVEEEVWVTDHYGLEAEFVITSAASGSV